MMDGSKLASGRARGASFQTGVQAGVEADLKLMDSESFMVKYGIYPGDYTDLVDCLREGKPLPDLKPVVYPEPEDLKPFDESKTFYENLKANVKVPIKVQYRAQAFGENIIVQRVEKTHSSNLVIPDNALAKSDIGFVVSVGEKCQSVKAGVLILFDQFAAHGNEVKLIDEEGIERERLLLKECDVLCLLEKVSSSEVEHEHS